MPDAPKQDEATDVAEETDERERHGVAEVDGLDMPVLFPPRDQLIRVVKALHADGYLVCLDVTAVDYLTYARRASAEGDALDTTRVIPGSQDPQRFEVVYHFLSHHDRVRVRIRVQVPEDDAVMPSLYEIHPGTEAAEREVFDMFGISFTGHPDLTRILMPEDWIGHPLRKDYHSGRIPVQFKDAPAAR
jgi:NADH-quinone oxidoreductase subunit C